MSLGTILLIVQIVLIVLLVATLPRWQHSRSWGYASTGMISVVLTIVLGLLLLGRI